MTFEPIDHPARAVVIGYGFAGRCFHSYLVRTTEALELYGVCSANPEKRTQIEDQEQCRAYHSFEGVLEDPDVDLVILATPHDTHAELAIRALEAGKHVVTDKVMALTEADCTRMIDTAEKAKRLLTVFHNRRWDGDFLTVRDLIDDGRLGEVRWMETAWQAFGPPRGWRGQAAKGGGRLYDLGAHLIDQILHLFPEPVESVYCRQQHDFPEHDVESHSLVVLRFRDGRTATCDNSSMILAKKPRYYICGTTATFVKHGVDPQEKAMIAGDIDAAQWDESLHGRLHDGAEEKVIPTRNGRWRTFYENVADSLRGDADPVVKPQEARRVVRIIEAAHRSAASGRVEILNETLT